MAKEPIRHRSKDKPNPPSEEQVTGGEKAMRHMLPDIKDIALAMFADEQERELTNDEITAFLVGWDTAKVSAIGLVKEQPNTVMSEKKRIIETLEQRL